MSNAFFEVIALRNDVRKILSSYFDKYLTREMRVYDVGCGDKPFGPVLKGKVLEHIGVDIQDGFYDSKHIDLIGSAYDVPIDNATADAVISSQVIEHLERPLDALKETSRILKPGGILFISFPFLYPIHAEPHDFTRFTEHGMDSLLAAHGFEVLEKQGIGGFWYLLAVCWNMYAKTFDRGFLKKIGIVRLFLWIFLWILTKIHQLEGFAIKFAKKNPEDLRRKWSTNYVYVAKKKET